MITIEIENWRELREKFGVFSPIKGRLSALEIHKALIGEVLSPKHRVFPEHVEIVIEKENLDSGYCLFKMVGKGKSSIIYEYNGVAK